MTYRAVPIRDPDLEPRNAELPKALGAISELIRYVMPTQEEVDRVPELSHMRSVLLAADNAFEAVYEPVIAAHSDVSRILHNGSELGPVTFVDIDQQAGEKFAEGIRLIKVEFMKGDDYVHDIVEELAPTNGIRRQPLNWLEYLNGAACLITDSPSHARPGDAAAFRMADENRSRSGGDLELSDREFESYKAVMKGCRATFNEDLLLSRTDVKLQRTDVSRRSFSDIGF